MGSVPSGNSPLATYYNEARNYAKGRNHKIDTITIHCYVGQVTAKSGCDYFASTDRTASSNYVVGHDGSIGLSVPENSRSYCTSNSANDDRAVTIEVASESSHPYAVTSRAYTALVRLVADICKRNGIPKLVWSTKKQDRVNHRNGCNMTVHRDYASKACPGQYLYDNHGKIASEVNSLLANAVINYGNDSSTTVIIVEPDSVNLMISELSATTFTVTVNANDNFSKYDWSYSLKTIGADEAETKKLKITAKTATITEQELVPATAYCLKVTAEDSAGNKIHSPTLIICTKQDYPDSVSGLQFSLDDNSLSKYTGHISFIPPKNWGEYANKRQNKGFRVSLIINGKIISHSDSLVSYTTSVVDKSITIKTLINETKPVSTDLLQLGIQTWVKDKDGTVVFDAEHPVCSQPVFISSGLSIVDKLFLNENDTFKRVILHNNIKK